MSMLSKRWRHLPLTALFAGMVTYLPATVAAPPVINIPYDPPFSGSNIHPNLLLNLSIEFPTVRNAYPGGKDAPYNASKEYIGYYNTRKCYRYTGEYFAIGGDARQPFACGAANAPFSGNFLNWATSSAIDSLRLALSGGNRYIDTPTQTVLARAYLPAAFYKNFFQWHTIKGSQAVLDATGIHAEQVFISNCLDKMFISDRLDLDSKDHPVSSCEQPAKTVAGTPHEYYARVEVCSAAEAHDRSDLCRPYTQSSKPVGTMQRYASHVRFGVMSYLTNDPVAYMTDDPRYMTDPNNARHQWLSMTRYGGVLRSPMKYIGEIRYAAPAFEEQQNPDLEWDPKTGVFHKNPDRVAHNTQSGIINYLNQFGSTGFYKVNDPVGELYYESIRYLQGKQPTGASPSNPLGKAYFGSEASLDGFPAHRWTDPVLASCQQNFVLMIADPYSHFDWYLPGGTPAPVYHAPGFSNPRPDSRPIEAGDPDVVHWTNQVGNFEKRPNLAGQVTGSSAEGSYYMAGLAYWANTHDIRKDKPVKVRTFIVDVDENGNGTLDSSRQPRTTQLYLSAKYGGFIDRNHDGNPFITKNSNGKIVHNDTEWTSDKKHKRPHTYFLANDPKNMIRSINSVFSQIANGAGRPPGITLNSDLLLSQKSTSFVFQASYATPGWAGTLQKIPVHRDDHHNAILQQEAQWEAGELLDSMKPDARAIYAGQRHGTRFKTVPFTWSSLSSEQQAALNTIPYDSKQGKDQLGEKRVAFLRGDNDIPDTDFRQRTSLLGDIINSQPVYVRAPATNIIDAGYPAFVSRYRQRTPAVYVGANDGMLHAFDADTGKELFAYVPDAVFDKLSALTAHNYVHRTYVDGPITVNEAQGPSHKWFTALVASFGSAVQGVFALDVTDPKTFGQQHHALWEFTDADDPDIGYVLGAVQIGKFKTAVTREGKAVYRYFAIVPSGINNYEQDKHYSQTGNNVLFLLALDKPADEAWEAGRNYYKFTAPIQDSKLANGLGAPTVVTGDDGAVSRIYAGDLQGNIWRFDVSGVRQDTSLADLTHQQGNSSVRILFTAHDHEGKRQPVMMPLAVVHGFNGGTLLSFATGKNIEPGDFQHERFQRQTLYTLHDNNRDRIEGRQQLEHRMALITANRASVEIHGKPFHYTGKDGKHGWYVDMPVSERTGERGIYSPVIKYGLLFFNSMIPSRDLCTIGSSRSYILDILTGLPTRGDNTGTQSTIGVLGKPIVFETQSKPSLPDTTGGTSTHKEISNVGFGSETDASGAIPTTTEHVTPPSQRSGRLSWRELFNWQDSPSRQTD